MTLGGGIHKQERGEGLIQDFSKRFIRVEIAGEKEHLAERYEGWRIPTHKSVMLDHPDTGRSQDIE